MSNKIAGSSYEDITDTYTSIYLSSRTILKCCNHGDAVIYTETLPFGFCGSIDFTSGSINVHEP